MLACSALGLMIVVGWAREVSLVQAGLTGTAVYVCAWAYRPGDGLDLPFLLAAALGTAVVMALSVGVSLASARLSGIYIMVPPQTDLRRLRAGIRPLRRRRCAWGRGARGASFRGP